MPGIEDRSIFRWCCPSLGTSNSGRWRLIDDPISNLDEHRALTTVQEIRRLAERAAQVIVLSHNKAVHVSALGGRRVDCTIGPRGGS